MKTNGPSKDAPLEERHPPYWWILMRFHMHLEALREMLDEVLPDIIERDRKRLDSSALTQVKALSPDQQQKLQIVLDTMVEHRRSGGAADPAEVEVAAAESQATSNDAIEAEVQADAVETDIRADAGEAEVEAEVDQALETAQADQDPADELMPIIKEVFQDDRHSWMSFSKKMTRAAAGPRRSEILHHSLLMQACTGLEVLIASLASRYYAVHQGALKEDKKEFSLADLQGFANLEDATDALLARRVADLMYGGLDDWADWFKSEFKADFGKLAMNWERVRESFQRRHLVTHTGAAVSRQYVENVKHEGKPPEIGTRLDVGADYLTSVFDEFEALGTALVVSAWGTWVKEEREESAGALLDRTYELMLANRWVPVEHLTKLGLGMRCSSGINVPLQCNHWLSRAELHGYEDVEAEVLEWDTATLATRFRMVKFVFLGRLDEAASLVPSMLASKELTLGQLREWPILRRLREFEGLDVSALENTGTPEESEPASR